MVGYWGRLLFIELGLGCGAGAGAVIVIAVALEVKDLQMTLCSALRSNMCRGALITWSRCAWFGGGVCGFDGGVRGSLSFDDEPLEDAAVFCT